MTIVREVADGIQLVAEGIDNIQKIYTAIRDGKEYLETNHPDVKNDVAAMCTEMRKTMQAIASASSIITNFKFDVSDPGIASQPTRFNDCFMQYKNQAMNIENQLTSLKGHCHIIQKHAHELTDKAYKMNLASMFKLFGFNSDQREQELSECLMNVYGKEVQVYDDVYTLRMILDQSLKDINQKLGPPGMMYASNVPAAAQALGEYAEHFSQLEAKANNMALRLETLVNELSG